MIIEARHNKAAQYVFKAYSNRLLRKNFSNFFLANLPSELPKEKSVILAPNHFSWWDGFFIYKLNYDLFLRKIFIMMLQEELERYWFFKYVGAYSIEPKNPVNISKALKYTQKLFKGASNAIVFYPQGEIESFDKRPLKLNKGLQLFIRNIDDNCMVLPVAFKIQHYNKKNPSIIFRAGRSIKAPNILEDFRLFEKEFFDNIDALNESAFNQSFVMDLFESR
ncbi:MAG: lysophospholipid acyltransferase family protein [Ignavibacteria bacterium]|nr:lysophospholipid acyltransferase family protein [Ignavibacteria bacterium]MBT8384041.1 lysophospholipid acyltransferase family protein [Ignavibacteria bacterium]MBT8392250.1 lysophospholipid acyltransferase family protein [Ignavibacteria bacterium]NNJ51757.1 hypothetical protein [Ignavibacteriaceae bacterium]NNL21799.1 hypothetical protein [Ignavibacteriaceae bacterium]